MHMLFRNNSRLNRVLENPNSVITEQAIGSSRSNDFMTETAPRLGSSVSVDNRIELDSLRSNQIQILQPTQKGKGRKNRLTERLRIHD